LTRGPSSPRGEDVGAGDGEVVRSPPPLIGEKVVAADRPFPFEDVVGEGGVRPRIVFRHAARIILRGRNLKPEGEPDADVLVSQPRVEPLGERLVPAAVADEAGVKLDRLPRPDERRDVSDELIPDAAAAQEGLRNLAS
jgi:hypothetical protein